MRELKVGSYRARTRQNVLDSDGTLVLNLGALEGGSRLTLDFAINARKPYMLLQLERFTPDTLAAQALQWLRREPIAVLNIAGPRESKRPGVHQKAREVFDAMCAARPVTCIHIDEVGAARPTAASDS